jgi:hypothetical protein
MNNKKQDHCEKPEKCSAIGREVTYELCASCENHVFGRCSGPEELQKFRTELKGKLLALVDGEVKRLQDEKKLYDREEVGRMKEDSDSEEVNSAVAKSSLYVRAILVAFLDAYLHLYSGVGNADLAEILAQVGSRIEIRRQNDQSALVNSLFASLQRQHKQAIEEAACEMAKEQSPNN